MQCAEIAEWITDWLRDYCVGAGLEGFVVGVSGGVDSALTSTLCARTGLGVHTLDMPIHQAIDQQGRASRHIARLSGEYPNVEGVSIDLTPAFEAFSAALPDPIRDDLTMANSRSRLRMTTLHAFASHHKRLVAGTGNKVEDFGIGFFTKYGDGGVDLSPIADLMKSEVVALAHHLGVVDEILSAPPTDGLWLDERTDEQQIGATYDELEWAMQTLAADKAASPEPTWSDRQREVVSIYQQLQQLNRHKMQPIPVCKIPDRLRAPSPLSDT